MKVIKVEPLMEPVVVEIENELEVLKNEVGGDIQCIYPFDEEVGLICNGDGKIIGLPVNCCLTDKNGNIYDILVGNFLIVGLIKDDFCSLTEEQIIKFSNLFSINERV